MPRLAYFAFSPMQDQGSAHPVGDSVRLRHVNAFESSQEPMCLRCGSASKKLKTSQYVAIGFLCLEACKIDCHQVNAFNICKSCGRFVYTSVDCRTTRRNRVFRLTDTGTVPSPSTSIYRVGCCSASSVKSRPSYSTSSPLTLRRRRKRSPHEARCPRISARLPLGRKSTRSTVIPHTLPPTPPPLSSVDS
jgi:hypothetical protein